MKELKEQLAILKRGAVEIIPEEEFEAKLAKSIKTNKPLIVKAGFDPTAPDLHLGHTVLLRKLRHFSDCGHKVIFLIGDYTGMIGDPTGRSKTRNQLTEEEVRKNAQTYKDQISRILDIKKIEIVFNSKWLSGLDLKDVIELMAKQTVARMIERDDFLKRYKNGDDISMVEFMYPLMQAYDSVALKADIELGGTDQKFNLLLGRTIQKRYSQEGQVILTMPLLEGTDGVEKMSKSFGNYIGIQENSKDMFGKIMSIPDEMIIKYMELLTDIPRQDIKKVQDEMKKGKNPRDVKIELAMEIVSQYYDKATSEKEKENFELLFSKKVVHDDIPVVDLNKEITSWPEQGKTNALNIINAALELTGKKMSNSEIKRKIEEGAISINNEKVKVFSQIYAVEDNMIIKIGKKIFIKHVAL
ncbi:MAG: tyrosine--tRNA ligase [Spirochaetes bacterium]|nr:tyrosine--tRNA ligase [Spirochaetota bacterium]